MTISVQSRGSALPVAEATLGGSYERELTTRVGRLELEVPRDRDGSFSTQLFERYQQPEKALVLALMQKARGQGVSTRRVKKITERLCGRRFAKSTVSELSKGLDGHVEAWAERALTECPFLIYSGAMQVKVRRQGAVRSAPSNTRSGALDDSTSGMDEYHRWKAAQTEPAGPTEPHAEPPSTREPLLVAA